MTKKEQTVLRRKFHGVVVAKNNEKTIVVRIDRTVVHPKYKKRYVRSRKYQVHDEQNEYAQGDKATFVECRPYSKTKRWRVLPKKTA
jgi:small subunit ribosomal protein S17